MKTRKPMKPEEYMREFIIECTDYELCSLRHHWSGATAIGEARIMILALIDVVQDMRCEIAELKGEVESYEIEREMAEWNSGK